MQKLYQTQEGRVFLRLWLTQTLSNFGSRLTFYAFGIWWFQETGATSPIFLTVLAVFLPSVLLSPLAGVIVDRNDRRLVLQCVNFTHIMTHSLMFLLIASGQRQLLPLLLLLVISGIADTFQSPAQYSSISALLTPEQLPPANALWSTLSGVVETTAPLAGAFLVLNIGMQGILLIDLFTYVVEMLVLFSISIPRPPVSSLGAAMQGGVFAQARQGFGFIFARVGLFSLQLVVVAYNFFNSLTQLLQVPLLLSRSSIPEIIGLVSTSYGIGVILGGIYMTRRGGFRTKVHGIIWGVGLSGICGTMLFGLGQSLPVWMLANFIFGFCLPIFSVNFNLIWQLKTPPDIQGRVFAARRMISHISIPTAYALGGPLADLVFKPTFSGLESSAWLLGGSSGRGYAAMFVVCGALMAIAAFSTYLRPAARNVERDIPDVVIPK